MSVERSPADPLADTLAGDGFVDTQVVALASSGPAVGRRRRAMPARPPRRSQLGRYEVLRMLGRGGMGTVVEAHDPDLDRRVALKQLHGKYASQLPRLVREARALAKLSHPHVVQVYEVGEADGEWFIAMELVDGQTLRAWQQPGRSWRECVEVYLQAGEGLLAAHAVGLTHRDFKPDNCIIDARGRVRVLDFGLVRSADDGAEPVLPSSEQADAQLPSGSTRSGFMVGTLGYMPVEQLSGQLADARSDLFAFCVSLYEALYGERPFAADSLLELMAAVQAGDVRPAPRGHSVPAALRKVLLRGLAPDPADRWSSMDVLLQRLRGLLARPKRWRGWQRAGLSAMLSVLSVVGVQWSGWSAGPSAPIARAAAGAVEDAGADPLLVSGEWAAARWSDAPVYES